MNRLLILDVSYLAWRAFYATSGLVHDGTPTGILYGLLRDLKAFRARFDADRVAFAFDSRRSLRQERFPYYKANRKKFCKDRQEMLNRRSVFEQVRRFHFEVLPALGHANILHERGYEADDLIAAAVQSLGPKNRAVVVAADADLYQVLRPGVVQHRPQRGADDQYGHLQFAADFHGTAPSQWPSVKALAGEKHQGGDNFPGCVGVGVDTAAKYFAGRIDPKRLSHARITEWLAGRQYQDNLALCRLPYEGCPKVVLRDDGPGDWDGVCRSLGAESLIDVRKGLKK